MKKLSARAKKRWDTGMTCFCALCYTACGVLWIWRAYPDDRFEMALGLVWLAGAAIWIVRAVRKVQNREENQETYNINGGRKDEREQHDA